MKKYLFFKENTLLLINFDVLLTTIELNCLNELDKYGLIKDYKIKLSKYDTKKIIYHHVIHGLCEEICNNTHRYKKVIVIPPKIRDFHELTNFCDINDIQTFINKLINKVKTILPFIIFFSNDYIFETDDINTYNTGEFKDILNILSEECDTMANKSINFKQIKQLVSKFKLDFLSQEYFNSIKTKLFLC